jgi:hypothetical protein
MESRRWSHRETVAGGKGRKRMYELKEKKKEKR